MIGINTYNNKIKCFEEEYLEKGLNKTLSEIQRLKEVSVDATAKSSNGVIGELEINIVYKQINYILGMIDKDDESDVLKKLIDNYLLIIDILLGNMSELCFEIKNEPIANTYKNLYKNIHKESEGDNAYIYKHLQTELSNRIKIVQRRFVIRKLQAFEKYLKDFKKIVIEKIDDNSYLLYTKYKGSTRKLNEQVLTKDEIDCVRESLYHSKVMVNYYYENKKLMEEK